MRSRSCAGRIAAAPSSRSDGRQGEPLFAREIPGAEAPSNTLHKIVMQASFGQFIVVLGASEPLQVLVGAAGASCLGRISSDSWALGQTAIHCRRQSNFLVSLNRTSNIYKFRWRAPLHAPTLEPFPRRLFPALDGAVAMPGTWRPEAAPAASQGDPPS